MLLNLICSLNDQRHERAERDQKKEEKRLRRLQKEQLEQQQLQQIQEQQQQQHDLADGQGPETDPCGTPNREATPGSGELSRVKSKFGDDVKEGSKTETSIAQDQVIHFTIALSYIIVVVSYSLRPFVCLFVFHCSWLSPKISFLLKRMKNSFHKRT